MSPAPPSTASSTDTRSPRATALSANYGTSITQRRCWRRYRGGAFACVPTSTTFYLRVGVLHRILPTRCGGTLSTLARQVKSDLKLQREGWLRRARAFIAGPSRVPQTVRAGRGHEARLRLHCSAPYSRQASCRTICESTPKEVSYVATVGRCACHKAPDRVRLRLEGGLQAWSLL